MTNKQKKFLCSEFWILSWKASMPRPRKLYKSTAKDSEKNKFKKDLIRHCKENILPQYTNGKIVKGEQHCNNIKKLKEYANNKSPYKHIIRKSSYNIGIAQKLLNLQLKYLWCACMVERPPHCPVDRIILERTKLKGKCNWTEIDSIPRYEKVIKAITEQATKDGYKSIAEWELCKYRRR